MATFIDKQPKAWKQRTRFGALDISATYAAVYSVILPKAAQVVDPFHVVQPPTAASTKSAAASRQNAQATEAGKTTRYRAWGAADGGRAPQPAAQRLSSLLELGGPNAEVAIAYRIKERLRDFYRAAALTTPEPCSQN